MLRKHPVSVGALRTAGALLSVIGGLSSAGAADTTTDASNALQEIVVTAQFTRQNLQDTPLAITATTAAMMDARSQTTVVDVAQRAPSVNVTSGGQSGGAQSTTVTIRGVGQTDYFLAVEPGVGLYVDDVYYGIMFGSTFELLDLDRVEVLRGPQGTLAGKNSEGGSLKLYSKAPDQTMGGYIEATYGQFNREQLRGSFNIPLTDTIALRVAALARHVDGFFDRLDYNCETGELTPTSGLARLNKGCVSGKEGGQDLVAVRGSLKWDITDKINDTLSADVTQDDSQPSPEKLIYQSPLWAGTNNFLTCARCYSNYSTYVGNYGTPQQYQAEIGDDARDSGISNVFNFEITDNLSLKSITAWRHTSGTFDQDGDASPFSVFQQEIHIEDRQLTQELRLSGKSFSVLDWTVGGFFYHADGLQASHIDIPGGLAVGGGGLDLDFLTNDPVISQSKSIFANGIFHVTDKLNVTAGLRETWESKKYTFVRRSPIDGGPVTGPYAAVFDPLDGYSNEYAGNKLDWRGAVDYRWTDQFMTYAQVATGFKGGGINPRPFFISQAAPFKPEQVTSYELGFKSDLFDRRLRLNVAGYFSKFKDIQLILSQCDDLSPFPGAPCTATRNAGDAHIKGAEVEAEFHPIDGLIIDASGSYTDFHYTSVNPTTGIKLSDSAPFVPAQKYAAGVQYSVPFFRGGSLTPRLDYTYQSSFQDDAAPESYSLGKTQAIGLANAKLTYTSAEKAWEFSGAITNLTDKFYYVNKYDRSNAPYFVSLGQPGRPREWRVSVKRSF